MNAAQQRIHRAALQLFAERGVTQVNVSDLAQAAGVARGTIYNNLSQPEALFENVAAELAAEMDRRVTSSFTLTLDPAARLANGIRFYVRRAHEEPHWGRFLCRFAFNNASLQKLWGGPPVADVLAGLQKGRYRFRPEQLHTVVTLIAGSVLGAIFLVLDGHKTWREAGSDAAELVLIAMGIAPGEARTLATTDLPPLPDSA